MMYDLAPSPLPEIPYKLLVQGVSDYAIFMLDLDGRVLSWSPGAERIKGYRSEEVVGRNFALFYTEEDRADGAPRRCLANARATGRWEGEGWRLRRDASRFWATVIIDVIYDDGHPVGFAKITRDCTEQRRHAEAIEAMASDLEAALSFLPCGACLLDAEGRIVLCNPALRSLIGPVEKGMRLVDVLRQHDVQDGSALELLSCDGACGAETASFEIRLGPAILAFEMRAAQSGRRVVTVEDITARRRIEERMLHRARHDVLTGMANRDALVERLDAALAACADTGGCAVLYLDLDRFKTINDTYGHPAGDVILKEAACRIRQALRPEDFACRLGGDEFVVVPRAPIAVDQAVRVAERLKEQLDKGFALAGRTVEVGVSIGIALSEPGASDHADLTGNADLALYQAKRDGRDCIRLFDAEMGLAVLKRRTLELQLSQALEAEAFTLAYQPVCAADGKAVKGFEALLRWQREDGAFVSPAEFVPLAEELGIMAGIGGWVLETACREAATWPSHLTVAVNVSATQMHDPRLFDRVLAALRRSGLDPHRLELEITETAMITDHALTLAVLTRLRGLGVMIAIDDFGTGYSSLSFLRTLPFTRVKIDRSFISDIADNPSSMAIVRGVMRMSRDLGLAVTAEGVENETQRAILLAEACQDLQGYLIARPMSRDRIQAFLSSACDAGTIRERQGEADIDYDIVLGGDRGSRDEADPASTRVAASR